MALELHLWQKRQSFYYKWKNRESPGFSMSFLTSAHFPAGESGRPGPWGHQQEDAGTDASHVWRRPAADLHADAQGLLPTFHLLRHLQVTRPRRITLLLWILVLALRPVVFLIPHFVQGLVQNISKPQFNFFFYYTYNLSRYQVFVWLIFHLKPRILFFFVCVLSHFFFFVIKFKNFIKFTLYFCGPAELFMLTRALIRHCIWNVTTSSMV